MSKEATEVDLNKPETWPEDIQALEALATGINTAASPDSDEDKPEVKPKAASAEKEGELDDKAEAAAAAGTDDPEVPAKPVEATETATPAEGDDDEDAPVLTKDGKRAIPFSVLQSERAQRRAAAERAAELEGEIEQLKQQLANPGAEAPAADVSTEIVLPEDIKAKAEKLRDELGEEGAEMFLDMFRLNATLKAQNEELGQLRSAVQQRETREQTRESDDIQSAIDSSPTMLEWQTAEDSAWWDRSIAMNKMLLNSDSEYAAMSLDERFAALPGRVLAAYGGAPPSTIEVNEGTPSNGKVGTSSAARAAAAQAALDAAAASATPKSMGDLPRGEAPAEKDSEVDRLEKMTPAETQVFMDKLASNPDKMAAFLANVM